MSASTLFSLVSSMAAVQVGVLISSFLFGVATLQAFFYYVTYKRDPLPLKLFSALVWLLELSGMVFAAHLLYSAAITPYRENPLLMFLDPPYQILATILASNWSGCAVQLYFVDRVTKFTKLRWPAVICWALILYTFVATLIIFTVALKRGLVEYTLHWRWLSISSLIISAVVDIFIALIMCRSLFKQRRTFLQQYVKERSGQNYHDNSHIVAVVAAILNLVLPYHLIYLGVYICLARIYANSFFASLNTRRTIRGDTGIESFKVASRSTRMDSSNNTAYNASAQHSKPMRYPVKLHYMDDGSGTVLDIK
ncbi:hypothetical protein PC9H_004500 [Pleurotus ostreatus]|uniref:DUF6534 domain-containing protein n=1 Tax=Pleurotus ostreatus TaxID=5322 RepID=A0A8H6ZY27_PLEOS|nr:uncharacterized protein PC9H_004500 [Pleurotus ostreatus]KAF7432559.1 hypothetical protein PC9H_004500 [Pleurotus ostreatus]